MLPPIPPWEGLHPLVVHFPIALLLIAPLFIIIGLIWRSQRRGFLLAALTLMVLGTAGAYVAVETGEAAGELALRTPPVNEAIEEHEELAETSRTVFSILTVFFAALVVVPMAMGKETKGPLQVSAHVAFIVIYMGGSALLANTAHHGGLLVHEYGIHALLPLDDPSPGPASPIDGHQEHEHDDDD